MSGMCDFTGRKVLVVGCHSGIGQATAKTLIELGAEVHGADVRACDLPLDSFHECDTRDPASSDRLLATVGHGIDALFYCSGLPQTRPPLDVLAVNFLGMRHLVESALERMSPESAISIIASTAGNGWMQRVPVLDELLATPDIACGIAWAEPKLEELGDPYMFSKEAVILWVMRNCARFVRAGSRLNCLSPGPTISGMTPDFDSFGGPKLIDVYTQPLGRRSSAQEQAWPLVFLGSREASYINGCNFITDAGFTSSAATGQIDVDALVAEAMA